MQIFTNDNKISSRRPWENSIDEMLYLATGPVMEHFFILDDLTLLFNEIVCCVMFIGQSE
jgi:hypothetical protein